MDNNHQQKDLSHDVMAEIRRRDVHMRPRLFFVVLAGLLGIGVAGAFVTALLFAIRLTVQFNLFSPGAFLRFGGPGLRPFLASFPWLSVLLALIGLGGGLYLLRRYDFSYKRRFLPVAVGAVALVALFGLVLGQAALGARLHESRAVGPFLHRPAFAGKTWIVGQVQGVSERSVEVITPRGAVVEIVWDERTRLPDGSDFEEGEMVRAAGRRTNGHFEARVLGDGGKGRPHAPHKRPGRRMK